VGEALLNTDDVAELVTYAIEEDIAAFHFATFEAGYLALSQWVHAFCPRYGRLTAHGGNNGCRTPTKSSAVYIQFGGCIVRQQATGVMMEGGNGFEDEENLRPGGFSIYAIARGYSKQAEVGPTGICSWLA
jgi:hypothetical protein